MNLENKGNIMEFTIKTVTDKILTIETNNQKIINHFNDPKNHTGIILEQINEENLYQKWLGNKKDINILDFGGNIGLFSLHVSDIAKKIITVEPTPDHIFILKELTKDFKNITIIEAALSDSNNMIPFYIDQWNSTCNSLRRDIGHAFNNIMVSGKTLKTILDENELDEVEFAKIDIEGSEYLALTKNTIEMTENRIKSWFVESHGIKEMKGSQLAQYLAGIFKSCGYSDIEIFGKNLDQMIVRK